MRATYTKQKQMGGQSPIAHIFAYGNQFPKQVAVGIILMLALFAFEIFNFDTTRYALNNLLGEVSFMGISWAAILAVAFCSIDFAGLVRMFTPEKGMDEPKEVWYLMGAWLLGATMNAMMTWWAVSLTLLNHQFGNEVLSRQELLQVVPIFVAVLVWLTRILFIGAFSVAGERLMDFRETGDAPARKERVAPAAKPATSASYTRKTPARPRPASGNSGPRPMRPQPAGFSGRHGAPAPTSQRNLGRPSASPRRAPMVAKPNVPVPQTDDMPSFLSPRSAPTRNQPSRRAPIQPKPKSAVMRAQASTPAAPREEPDFITHEPLGDLPLNSSTTSTPQRAPGTPRQRPPRPGMRPMTTTRRMSSKKN